MLRFQPRPTDHGKTLTCRAENTELSNAAIEDHWRLTIHCKPISKNVLLASQVVKTWKRGAKPQCAQVKLDHFPVLDAPTVALTYGSNLDPANIAEGNDVYFECKISANPDVYKVVWLHNVSSILEIPCAW